METMILIIIIAAASGALLSWIITRLVLKARYVRDITEKDASLKAWEERMAAASDNFKSMLQAQKESFDSSVEEIRKNQETAITAARNELAASNAENLKTQNEAFKQQAEASMKHLTDPMRENMKSLEETLNGQKEAHIKDTASISRMVQTMSEQLNTFSASANSLTGALKGSNSIQGHLGEQKLLTIFSQASLTEGIDYDTQVTMHDRYGNSVTSEENGKRYRPDYIFTCRTAATSSSMPKPTSTTTSSGMTPTAKSRRNRLRRTTLQPSGGRSTPFPGRTMTHSSRTDTRHSLSS